ncbi:Ku protein [Polyangium sp. y55x31]|uniref:non-homologous end joining protein Ku n=1 Tax=Polyangium sp. y55x31 TaxID=3042688 RepID=UPI0024823578|nr:Ku protein [Polyangium sp. y55x31]MDI1477976.1 Ku protein [Polyangium sp. y55x31]
MAARSTGTGTISFGLVSIPVKLYTATSSHGVGFHMLHKKCGTRVKQQLFCPYDREVVERSDTMRGFEYAREQYVEVTDQDLDAVRAERTDRIDIVEFVPAETVDLLYVDKTNYLGPDKGGARAYKLLADAMERTKKIAVGRYGVRGKDQLVLLRPYKGGLIMHQVYYADEVRPFEEIAPPAKVDFRPQEEDLADRLIGELSADAFHPENFHDQYQERLTGLIEKKVAGQEISLPPAEPQAQIIDLFEALKQSLKQRAPAAAAPSAPKEAEAPAAEEAPAEEAPPRPSVKKAAPRRPPRERVRKAG